MVYFKLNIYNEDDQSPFSIYQTEIGAFAIGSALTDDLLFALCRDHGDSKGSLKFFVSHSSAPVHEQAPPPAIDFTVPPPVLPQHSVTPLRPRHGPSSRHGSVSSASEHLPLELAAGYEADLDNPDRESHRTTTRSSQPAPQPLPTTTNAPSSPHRRPSGPPAPRPSSPLLQSPAQPSTPPLPQAAERLRYQKSDATFVDKYGHVIPTPPPPPPLSPHRPSFSTNDDSTLSPPASRLHVRSGSDAGADREQALRASEEKMEKQWQRIRQPAAFGRLRAEASKETLNQTKESRLRKRYPTDSDDVLGRSDSWVVVPQGGGRSVDQEQTQELPRTSPPVSKTSRQQHSPRYGRPSSPYAPRVPTIPNPPRQQPPVVPISNSDIRPSAQRVNARNPVPSNFIVTWKPEDGAKTNKTAPPPTSTWNRLGKGHTKSMDNLRASSSLPASLQPGRRNPPQLPMSRQPTNLRDLSYSPSNLPGMPKSYEPPRPSRPLPVQGSPHGSSLDFSSQYGSRPHGSNLMSPNGSNLMSPSHDPYPRPQSAAGDSMTSPTQRHPRQLQSPTYGSTLDSGDPARSPRTMSPSRSYFSAGVPGPRPQLNYSDRSDRSSDVQSGPETSNTTPPRTPISPQSPRYGSSETTAFVVEPSSPTTEPPIHIRTDTNRSSELTLKQEEHAKFAQLINGIEDLTGTTMPSRPPLSEKLTRSLTPPPPSSSSSETPAYSQDDDDSDPGGGTWIVRPSERPKSVSRPPLKVQIESSTESSSMNLQLPPQAPPPTSYRPSAVSRPKKLVDRKMRGSTFTGAGDDSWAPRPPPEDVYERLEEFFPEHDLDKPVIEASSGGTSPTTAEPMAPPPTPVPDKGRVRAKKSIRIVAEEHKKRIDRTSKADATSYTNNMLRKRNTKLWGSRMEEMTSEFAKSTSNSSLPESSPGGPSE